MALTANHANNELIKFKKDVAFDFYRANRLDPFTGEGGGSIITRHTDLAADGKEIRIPLVTNLTGNGVGAGTLTGNEEQIDSYGFPMWADWARNAVANNINTEKESSFSISSTARTLLRTWAKRVSRDDLIDMMLSIPTASVQANRLSSPGNRINGVTWAAATAAQKNAWTAANVDRVLFGSAVSNYSATFATAAANVDNTSDKMTANVLSLAKEIAQNTGYSSGAYNGKPKITPWMIENSDEEYFVCFVGQRAMRDLRADSTMAQANRDARARENNPEKTNPIFTGGALIWNGIIVKEVPEITQRLILSGVGASSIDVEPYFFCGLNAFAQAIGDGVTVSPRDETDYGFLKGVGVRTQYGVGKVAKSVGGSLVDWGCLTGFVAGVASA